MPVTLYQRNLSLQQLETYHREAQMKTMKRLTDWREHNPSRSIYIVATALRTQGDMRVKVRRNVKNPNTKKCAVKWCLLEISAYVRLEHGQYQWICEREISWVQPHYKELQTIMTSGRRRISHPQA